MEQNEQFQQEVTEIVDALENLLDARTAHLSNPTHGNKVDELSEARRKLKEALALALMPFFQSSMRSQD